MSKEKQVLPSFSEEVFFKALARLGIAPGELVSTDLCKIIVRQYLKELKKS